MIYINAIRYLPLFIIYNILSGEHQDTQKKSKKENRRMHNSRPKRLNCMDQKRNYSQSSSSVPVQYAQNINNQSQHLSSINNSRTLSILSNPIIVDLTGDDEETTSSGQISTLPIKRTKYFTNGQDVNLYNTEVHSQAHPMWYRVVSYVLNDEPPLSRPVSSLLSNDSIHDQQVRPQMTLTSHPNWYCQVTSSNASDSSQQSQSFDPMACSQITSLNKFSQQAHSSRSYPEINNLIPQDVSQPIQQLKSSNSSTSKSDKIRSRSSSSSPEIIYTSTYPNPPHIASKSNRTGPPHLSSPSRSRLIENRNLTNIRSSESSCVNNSNHAQVIIDVDDFPVFERIQSQLFHTHSANQIRPSTQSRTLSSDSIDRETIEVVFRSRNNESYTVNVTNPDVIQMHRILQRRLSDSDRRSSSGSTSSDSDLFQQVNNYISLLSSTVTAEADNFTNVSSLLGSLVPQSLTIDDQSSYSLLNINGAPPINSDEMPPVHTIDRIQNGKICLKNVTRQKLIICTCDRIKWKDYD